MDYFSSLVRHFKKEFAEYDFSVRRVRLKTDFGYCRKLPSGKFEIRISNSIDEYAQLIVLPHEVGHMLSWEKDTHRSEHGPLFGISYSRAWQSYLRWINT